MDVRELIDRHTLIAIERQLVLADLLGADDYAVDLGTGSARIGDLEMRVGLLGSAAPGPGTWLWGWANPGGYPPEVLASAERVRAFGAEHGIGELTRAEVPLGDDWDATAAAVAACAAAGLGAYLPVPADSGTEVILAVDSPLPEAPPTVEPTRLGPVLTQAIQGGIVGDWRLAFEGYAEHRGGGLRVDGRSLVLEPAGGDHGATIEIDELGRVTSLSMTRSAEPFDPAAPATDDAAPAPEERRRGLFRRRR